MISERLSDGQREAIERQSLALGMRVTELIQVCRKVAGRSKIDAVGQLTPDEASVVLFELGVPRIRKERNA